MLSYTFIRIIIFALQNFWRNIWLTTTTVSTIVVCLCSISILVTVNVLSTQALTQLQDRVDITVYLKPELISADIQKIKQSVEKLPVKRVDLISASDALQRFRAKHQGNDLITESLLELSENPLSASLVIHALTTKDYSAIMSELQSSAYAKYIKEARYDDYQTLISKVEDFTNRVQRVALFISMGFLFLTLLVVFNAMRLNIYTHREEIAIMRLVGASTWFIRGPFLIEGILYAGLATLVTATLFFPVLSSLQPYINSFFNGGTFNSLAYFKDISLKFFGWQFLGAALLNTIASLVAMRRYLKQ